MEREIQIRRKPDDRRASVRFLIEQDLRYKVISRAGGSPGTGKTVNISSNGVLFTTDHSLSLGERLEVAMNWPAELDHGCPLQLVTTG